VVEDIKAGIRHIDSYNKWVWIYESLSPSRWSLRPPYFYPIFTTNDGVFLAVFFNDHICSGTGLQPLLLTAQYR